MDPIVEQPITNTPTTTFAKPAEHEVGKLVRTGVRWSFARLIARQFIGIVATMILARLILPRDYGLVNMVLVVIPFFMLLDTGLTWATVQAERIDQETINSMFWQGALLGVALWIICAALGPALAWFYHEPAIVGICLVVGAGLTANSLAGQLSAMAKRKINQALISSVETYALLLANLIAIGFAYFKMGYWAIVAQAVSGHFLRMLGYLLFSTFRPGRPHISRKSLELAIQGILFGSCNWLNYFQLYFDSVLVGRYCGAQANGYYNLAFSLRTLPTSYSNLAVNDIAIPAISALRDDKPRMGEAYRRALSATVFFSCPFGIILGMAAAEVVGILYGPHWSPVIPILRWFALPAVMIPIINTTTWLFIANGKGREQLITSMVLTPLAIVGFMVAVVKGVVPLAAMCAFLFTIPFPIVSFYASHKAAGISVRATARVLMPILFCSLAAALGMYLVGLACAALHAHIVLQFIAKLGVGGIIYLGGSWLLIRPLPFAFLMRRG